MLKNAFPIALRMLPLTGALFLMAADGEACIIIDNSNGGDDECFDLDELCPNLVCDNGNVVVDGCAICECEDIQVCEPGSPPDCANAFLNDDCSWTCGGGECFSDADCGDGAFCDFGGLQTPDGAADRIAAGVCQFLPPTGCSSDVDCGPGFFCALSDENGGSGGESPPAPDGDRAMLPPDGVCLPLAVECFSNDDCARGQHCEQWSPETDPSDPTAGLVAPGGICVDDGAACTSDRDCDGGACFDGLCVDQGCFSDIDCGPGQACLGTDVCACTTECQDDGQGGCIPCDCASLPGICIDIGTGDCLTADVNCPTGQHCEVVTTGCDVPTCEIGPDGQEVCFGCDPILSGICVDDTLGGECAFDSDCNPDEVCVLDGATEPDCLLPEGCANRPAPAPTGTCQPVDPIPADGCYSDMDCAAGTRCNAGVDVCELPPDCVAGEACLAVCYGSCVAG